MSAIGEISGLVLLTLSLAAHDPERTWKLRHIECFAGRRRSFASPTAGISQIVSHPWTRPRGGRVNLLAHLDPRVLDHLCPMRNLGFHEVAEIGGGAANGLRAKLSDCFTHVWLG